MSSLSSEIECHISNAHDRERFAEWAFGKDYEYIERSVCFLHHWNLRHGEVLRLSPSGLISEDVKCMVEMWRDNEKE